MTSADNSPLALFMQEAAKKEFGLKTAATSHFSKQGLKDLTAKLVDVDEARAMRGAQAFLREMHNSTQEVFKKEGIKELRVFRGVKTLNSKTPTKIKKVIRETEEKLIKTFNDALIKRENWRKEMEEAVGTLSDEGIKALEDKGRKLLLNVQTAEILQEKGSHMPIGFNETVKAQPMSSFSTAPTTAKSFISAGQDTYGTMLSSNVPVERIIGCPRTGYGCYGENEVVVLGGTEKTVLAVTKGGGGDASAYIETIKEMVE